MRKLPEQVKKEKQAPPVRLRPASEADVNFIFSSWLRSYRESDFAKPISNTIYFTEHHKVIERLLKTCTTYVACSTDDVADIYGYIVGEHIDGIFVLHYIYVKHTFRLMGIGTLLLNCFDFNPGAASIFTHRSRLADRLANKYNMVHSPYLALTPEYRGEEKGEVPAPISEADLLPEE